jgi:hypothetical protein
MNYISHFKKIFCHSFQQKDVKKTEDKSSTAADQQVTQMWRFLWR